MPKVSKMKVYIVFYYDGGASNVERIFATDELAQKYLMYHPNGIEYSNQCLGVEEYDVLVELPK